MTAGQIRTSLEQRTPLGRVGRPSDIAGLISFLTGPDGEFMTGSYLLMDGGIRDASGIPQRDPEDPRVQEAMRHMAAGEARRQKLQPLIDRPGVAASPPPRPDRLVEDDSRGDGQV